MAVTHAVNALPFPAAPARRRRVRLPLPIWLVVAYLGAITIFGKGPTYLGYPPLFWGEAVLALGLVWTLWRQGMSILGPPALRRLSTAVLLFLLYGAVLTARSFPDWGIDALRDAAVWYYGGFYFIGLALASRPRAADRVWKMCGGFWVCALLWGVAENLTGHALSAASPLIPWRQVPVLSGSHSDVIQNMSLGAIVVVGGLWKVKSPLGRLLLQAAALTGFVLTLLAWGRGVKVGLAMGILAVLVLGLGGLRSPRLSSRLGRLAGMGLVAAIVVVGVAGVGVGELGHIARFEEISFAGSEGSIYWRLVWWRNLLDELLARNVVFGLGFGENLGYYNPYLLGDEDSAFPIRAPHNVNITVLTRMGAGGFLLWGAILCFGLGGLFLRLWRGGMPGRLFLARRREELAFWLLMLLTTWGNGSFGVLMEGPVLGVWFWFALGFASGRSVYLPAANRFIHQDVRQPNRAANVRRREKIGGSGAAKRRQEYSLGWSRQAEP